MEHIYNLTAGWGTETALALSIFVFFLMVFMVIPLQIKEALVKNGLITLRRQMLIGGVTISILSLVVLFTLLELVIKQVALPARTEFFQLLNAFSFFILATTYHKIYHQQFSPKQKHIHKLASDIERKENKVKSSDL